jgi:hypothetical protein
VKPVFGRTPTADCTFAKVAAKLDVVAFAACLIAAVGRAKRAAADDATDVRSAMGGSLVRESIAATWLRTG